MSKSLSDEVQKYTATRGTPPIVPTVEFAVISPQTGIRQRLIVERQLFSREPHPVQAQAEWMDIWYPGAIHIPTNR